MYMYVSMYVCISDPGKRVGGEAKVQEESSLESVDRGAERRRKDRSGTWGGRNETGGTRAVVGMGKEGEGGGGKAGRTKWGLVIGVTVGFRGLKAAESSVRVGHTTAEKGSSRLANGSSVSVGRNVY